MSATSRSRRVANRPWLRLLLTLATLLGLAATTLSHLRFDAQRSRVAELVERPDVGSALGELAAPLRREQDLDRARSVVARALVAAALDQPEDTTTSAGAIESLEVARRAAAETLSRRPAMVTAATALGAATYLEWRRTEDRRLFTEARSWERPLQLAREISPQQSGAPTFLTMAYLELWRTLSPQKHEFARSLVREALADPRFFSRLVGSWLEIAASREEALDYVPATSAAWNVLERLFYQRQDWGGYLEASERARSLKRSELSVALDEAAELRRRGDAQEARELYLAVGAQLAPGRETEPLMERVLLEAPGGIKEPRFAEAYRAWFEYAIGLCGIGACPLPDDALARLPGLAGSLEPAELALAALWAGRPEEAEQLERSVTSFDSDGWFVYLLSRAGRDLRRGRPALALAALESVPVAQRASIAYWELRHRAAMESSDPVETRRSAAQMERSERRRFDGGAFAIANGRATLRFGLRSPASAITLELTTVGQPSAVEVRLDGELLRRVVITSRELVEMDIEVPPGSHLLSLVRQEGGSVEPLSFALSGA